MTLLFHPSSMLVFFFFNDTATTEIYTLSHTTLFRSPFRIVEVEGVVVARPFVLDLAAHVHVRSEEHTSELQSRPHLVCRLLLEKRSTGRGTDKRHDETHGIGIRRHPVERVGNVRRCV